MKNKVLILILSVLALGCSEHTGDAGQKGQHNTGSNGHPVLLIKAGDEAEIKEMVNSNPKMRLVQQKVYSQANAAVKSGPSSYVLTGIRLLDVSRRSLQNLFSLSYAYRMSKQQQYLDAAIAELDAVCAFPDWHPSHYLDVAEMCMGVAIAYDWLYEWLPQQTRYAAEKAIEEFALNTGVDPAYNKGFLNSGGNWNQVCSAGLFFGAAAIKDKSPELAAKVMEMCRSSIKAATDSYNPDGAYAEGPGYWAYGTDFNVMLNYADNLLGHTPYVPDGFRKTPYYYFHTIAPSGKRYNYSDCGLAVTPDIAEFYFAGLTGDNSLLWWDMKMIDDNIADNRLLPAILVIAKDLDMSKIPAPSEMQWTGGGRTPVYFARNGWNSDAAYMGIKGGKAQDSHSHMDAGSFVYEAEGLRWAIDYGNENYTNVENAGVSLWNMSQNSGRWKLLAYNNRQHNTITLGGKDLVVSGKGEITDLIDSDGKQGVVLDLTPCYENVSKVTRTACLYDDGSMETVDVVKPNSATEYCWTMISDSRVSADTGNDGSVVLYWEGKKLMVTVSAYPEGTSVKASSELFTPATSCESMRGRRTTFTAAVPSGVEARFTVVLKPVK